MKSIHLLKSIILLLILSSLTACEEAELTVLPLDTQLGNNTFGCYVDGTLFVRPYHNNSWGQAFYDRATKKVSVIAKSKDNRSISFIITDTQLYNNNIVDRATYSFLSDTVTLINPSAPFCKTVNFRCRDWLSKNLCRSINY